jgi:hypothetical protein
MSDTSYRDGNWWDRWLKETGKTVPEKLQVRNRLGVPVGDDRRNNMKPRGVRLRLVK